MNRDLGMPRSDLIDLLSSTVGAMVARRIDEEHDYASATEGVREQVKDSVKKMLALVQAMNRDQLELCDPELNRFFRMIPFSEAIPVVIEIEYKWPHHIETLDEVKQRLDLIRKGGEYAVMFSDEKILPALAGMHEITRRQ